MTAAARPTVSAILTVHDRTAYLADALRSVRSQDYEGDIEVVVVDDGSDVPAEPAFRPEFPEVRWVRQENRGVCAARQAGCDHAGGEYLAFLDDDDAWHPTKTRLQLRLLESRPDLAAVGSDLTALERLMGGGTALFRERGLVAATSTESVGGHPDAFVLDSRRLLQFIFGQVPLFPSSLLLSRASLRSMGGWNSTIRGPGDCHDFLARLTHGRPLGYLDRPLLGLRRGHADHMTHDKETVALEEAAVLCRLFADYPEALRRAVRKPLAGSLERVAHWARTSGRFPEAVEVLRKVIRLDGLTVRRWTNLVTCRVRALRAAPAGTRG